MCKTNNITVTKEDYTCSFCTFLQQKGYKETCIDDSIIIKSRQLTFSGVAVKGDDGKIIQAFALMSDKARRLHNLYPFYRTHRWGAKNGNTYPSCSIACKGDDGEWRIYDAHNSRQERNADYLDYDNALARFRKRLEAAPARELNFRAQITCWILAGLLSAYLIVRTIWPSLGLPLDGDVVVMFILIVVLILLPTFLPLFKSISFFGIDLIIGRD